MGERTILVCDICGRPAMETVTFKVGRRNLQKDYCGIHLQELTVGARTPRRGRRPGVVTSPAKRRGRPPKAATTAAKHRGRPKKASSTAKRPGRPRKIVTTAAPAPETASSEG
jgi:hypothetical protein